jgi:hypothetical protein
MALAMTNEGSISNKIPTEIWLKIISNLDDEVDEIMLSRACRRTRALFPPRHFAVASKYWKEERLETFRLRQWNDLIELDNTRQLVDRAACGICKKAHEISAFQPGMLAMSARYRACKGARGFLRVCEHKVLVFEDIKLALRSKTLGLICGEHPHKVDAYDERIFWDMGLMKDPKKKEIKTISDDEYNVIGFYTDYACMATGYERALERETLEDILARDETPICRHLRRCDLMATYSSDEDHRARDAENPKFCSHPSCLTTYAFFEMASGTVALEVTQYLGMARSPSDLHWLEAVNEMREIEEVDATEQKHADAEKEVDTQEDEDEKAEEEHPLSETSEHETEVQRDMGSTPPIEYYPSDSDGDCMCAGTCMDCTGWRRKIPLPRRVKTPRGLDWVFPGDVGFYVYR